jgi:hypothetical protein
MPVKKNKTDELKRIFREIKILLKKYEPPFSSRINTDSKYDLWSENEMTVLGKKKKEMFFAATQIQSNYVGFYFMPVYENENMKRIFKKELLSLLKGKSCFHIKNFDRAVLTQIKDILKSGLNQYKKNGWV